MLALVGFLNTLNLKLLERRSIKTSKKGIVPLDSNSKVNLREGYKLLMKSKNGCKLKEFGTKDWLYVEFMTIIFLLVVWIILLNK